MLGVDKAVYLLLRPTTPKRIGIDPVSTLNAVDCENKQWKCEKESEHDTDQLRCRG